ncbi:MAG: tetratricopeptide repeat protein [Firmicutes bacterium]|nr:tetratricopeptide repeat protein [Bacillota bacterium]
MQRKLVQKRVIPIDLSAEAYRRRAHKWADRQEYGRALRYLRRASERAPQNAAVHFDLARLLSEMGFFEESIAVFEYLMKELRQDEAEYDYWLSVNYGNLGEFETALRAARRYLERAPAGELADEAEELIAILEEEQDEVPPEEASETEDPTAEGAAAENEEARLLLEDGHFQEASAVLEQAVSRYPDAIALRNNLALAYFHEGKVGRAIQLAESVIERDQGNIHAHCNLALFHMEMGNRQKAEQEQQLLCRLRPLAYDQREKLASTLGILGADREALALFYPLYQHLGGFDPILAYFTGIAAFNAGRPRLATQIWRQLIENGEEDEEWQQVAEQARNALAVSEWAHRLPYTIGENEPPLEKSVAQKVVWAPRLPDWYPQWLAVADVLESALGQSGRFQQAAALWAYVLTRMGTLPRLRKPEAWAAAIETVMDRIQGSGPVSVRQYGERYRANPRTVSEHVRLLLPLARQSQNIWEETAPFGGKG